MIDHVDLTYAITGQTLYLDAPEGVPSSVTSVEVFEQTDGDDDTAESATTGSASIDSASTTVDAASGRLQADPRVLNVTATTNFVVGRSYLVTGAAGEREWLTIAEIASGVSVTARHPLANDFASADVFASTRISIAVSSTWAADEVNLDEGWRHTPRYRVRWRYVVAGVTYVRVTTFSLTRAAGAHNISADDIDRLLPGWIQALPVAYRDDRGRALIDEAYQQVGLDLYQEEMADERVRDPLVMGELVKRKAVELWAESRFQLGGGDPIAADRARALYQQRFDSIFRSPSRTKAPFADADGAARPRRPLGLSRR